MCNALLNAAIEWTGSAGKHGFSLAEAMFSGANHYHHVPEFDEPRVGGRRPDLYIGPSRLGGPLLEVMLVKTPPRDLSIFHVMEVRDKILKRAEEADQEEREK